MILRKHKRARLGHAGEPGVFGTIHRRNRVDPGLDRRLSGRTGSEQHECKEQDDTSVHSFIVPQALLACGNAVQTIITWRLCSFAAQTPQKRRSFHTRVTETTAANTTGSLPASHSRRRSSMASKRHRCRSVPAPPGLRRSRSRRKSCTFPRPAALSNSPSPGLNYAPPGR